MKNLASYIDHTILKANATTEEVKKLCSEADEYKFASVCVNSCQVPLCSELLKDSSVKVCTVVGFPLGAASSETKAFETLYSIAHGADEIDMVINVGAVKDKNWDFVLEDIKAVRQASLNKVLKVILEVCLLTDEEIVKVCELCMDAKVDFVKTSTGFSTGGATVESVRLMRKTVGPDMGVKAAGGIRDRETALKMIEAGANRLGCSAGVAIVKGEESNASY